MTTTTAPAPTLAEAQAQLDQAETDLKAAQDHVEQIKESLKTGQTTYSAGDYADAVRKIEFLELARDGAKHRLDGARKLHKQQQEKERQERRHKAMLDSARAVLTIAEQAPAMLAAIETALAPCTGVIPGVAVTPTWQNDLVTLRGILHRFAGGGIVGTGGHAAMASREITILNGYGITTGLDGK